ncbi:MAG TPA: TerB family tellurite resistance protein [Chryseosolibacter sp.]
MSALAQMKLLINLAQIDGSVAEREQNYIVNIGRANGIYPDEIRPLFNQTHDNLIPDNLARDEKFKYIFSLVQLMKIDERMYKEEILFCSSVATKLGYAKEAMFELLLHVRPGGMSDAELKHLQSLTEKHLK